MDLVLLDLDLSDASGLETVRQEDDPLPLLVNLSARQLEWGGLVDAVSEILEATGLPPELLRFEVTERLMTRASQRMEALREIGVELYVDDFGVGYSSLSYLRDLPVDGLKIDRSFIGGVDRDTSDAALVRAILAMGEALELAVVAEGVESEGQRRRLLEMGCRLGQGFHFVEPRAAGPMGRWLEERRS